MKVPIIDDSERLLRSLGRGLTKAGFAVDLAADGDSGLAFAETYDYDAIVLDLMLPGVPGLEVLRRLREAGRDTHILILSAKDRVEDRVKGLETEDHHLYKRTLETGWELVSADGDVTSVARVKVWTAP